MIRERLTTVQYPEEKLPPQENARTIPFLVYDGEDPVAGLRCTACTICAQECPAHCIEIVKDTVKKPDYLGKMQLHPKVFNIDMAVCMELRHLRRGLPVRLHQNGPRLRVVQRPRSPMVLQKADLAKSNEYYPQNPSHRSRRRGCGARAEEQRKAQAKKAAAPFPPAS